MEQLSQCEASRSSMPLMKHTYPSCKLLLQQLTVPISTSPDLNLQDLNLSSPEVTEESLHLLLPELPSLTLKHAEFPLLLSGWFEGFGQHYLTCSPNFPRVLAIRPKYILFLLSSFCRFGGGGFLTPFNPYFYLIVKRHFFD